MHVAYRRMTVVWRCIDVDEVYPPPTSGLTTAQSCIDAEEAMPAIYQWSLCSIKCSNADELDLPLVSGLRLTVKQCRGAP